MKFETTKHRSFLALVLAALFLFLFLFGQLPIAHNHALNQTERENCPAYLIQTQLIQGLDIPVIPVVFIFLPQTDLSFPEPSFVPTPFSVFSEHTRSPPPAI